MKERGMKKQKEEEERRAKRRRRKRRKKKKTEKTAGSKNSDVIVFAGLSSRFGRENVFLRVSLPH